MYISRLQLYIMQFVRDYHFQIDGVRGRVVNNGQRLYFFMILLLWAMQGYAQEDDRNQQTITIRAVAGMQYDKVRFQVEPGSEVTIIFENTDDIDHNLLITEPDSREEVVEAALELGERGMEMNFIPRDTGVLWSTPVLSSGESDTLTFNVPQQEGIYPYVCTFPGHGTVMYGAMYVSTTEAMPPLKEDRNIPPSQRGNETEPKKILRPYKTEEPPYVYRTSMPGAGPAAIAVHLPDSISYCWDPDVRRLRYIWRGKFIDNSVRWSTKGDATANVLGTVFYRDQEQYPLRIGRKKGKTETEYKGYKLVKGGYPEFHYTVDGYDVYERITQTKAGNGIQRTFKIPEATQNIYFSYVSQHGVKVEADRGVWKGSTLVLEPEAAKHFTITMEAVKN